MYFPGHKLNNDGLILKRKGPEDQKLMIAIWVNAEPETYQYRIVLQLA